MAGTSEIISQKIGLVQDFLLERKEKIGTGIGYAFTLFADIVDDRHALTKLLKTARYTAIAYAQYRGHGATLSRIGTDWDTTIGLLEGIGFVRGVSELLKEKENSLEEQKEASSLFGRIADWTSKATGVAFCVADIAGGVVWILALEIPILGPLSNVKMVVTCIGYIADLAALTGFVTDAITTMNKIANSYANGTLKEKHWNYGFRLGENVTTATVIIFGVMGTPALAPITISVVGISSGLFGLAGFALKQNRSQAKQQIALN
ncbi:MAG: hypothetical protein ACXU9U_01760 [Parachlamydiaceae bacterium]